MVDRIRVGEPPSEPVFLRFGQLLGVVVCLHLTGGQWALLQTAAWVGMLADYGRSHGIEKAVAMTFDGDHPCDLCRKIEAAKKRESSPPCPAESAKRSRKRSRSSPPPNASASAIRFSP